MHAPDPHELSASLDDLCHELSAVHGTSWVAVRNLPDGIHLLVAFDTEGVEFLDGEEAAIKAMLRFRRSIQQPPLDMLCINGASSETIALDPAATIISLNRRRPGEESNQADLND